MTRPRSRGSAFSGVVVCLVAFCFAALAYGQINYYPIQEVRITDLPELTSKSKDPSDVLATSLETLFRDKAICCGKNSALEDDVQRADPKSLKDIGDKLRGRQLLSDGRPIMVTAEYIPAASVNSGYLVEAMTQKRALLIEWNSRLYVVCGVSYGATDNADGGTIYSIAKIFWLDTRFSDERRQVTFDRQTDDWGKVQGTILVKATAQ